MPLRSPPPPIFLSHPFEDTEAAIALAKRLMDGGITPVRHPSQFLLVGDQVHPTLEAEMKKAAVWLILRGSGPDSPGWYDATICKTLQEGLAEVPPRPTVVVCLPGVPHAPVPVTPSFLASFPHIPLPPLEDKEAFQALKERLVELQGLFRPEPTLTIDDRARLVEILKKRLNNDELHVLCAYLDIPYVKLEGETWERKLWSLVAHVEREGKLNRLLAWLEKERPQAWTEWQAGFPPRP